jgi:hypothetical protein
MKIKKEKKYKNTRRDLKEYCLEDLKFHVICLENNIEIKFTSNHLYGCIEDITSAFKEKDKKKIDAKVVATTTEDKPLMTVEFKLIDPSRNEYDDTLARITEHLYGDFSSAIPCLSF